MLYTVESFLFMEANEHRLSKFCCLVKNINLWVIGLLHYNARQFINVKKNSGDIDLWVREIHKIHEHQTSPNDDQLFHSKGKYLSLLNFCPSLSFSGWDLNWAKFF